METWSQYQCGDGVEHELIIFFKRFKWQACVEGIAYSFQLENVCIWIPFSYCGIHVIERRVEQFRLLSKMLSNLDNECPGVKTNVKTKTFRGGIPLNYSLLV